jgi:replication-associated recombination protein RarA
MVDYKTRGTVHNDEPSLRDLLGREQFVAALARVAATCETPLVIGLYGSWGIGKTSLMRQIESVVAAQYQTKTIWFPSWQHQFDEAPPLALLHAMVDSLKLGGEAKKLVALVATTLGAAFLKLTSSISLEDIDKVVQWYEDERFQIGERQVRLSAYVRALVNKATEEGRRRLVSLSMTLTDACLKLFSRCWKRSSFI